MPDAPAPPSAYAVNLWMHPTTGEVKFWVAGSTPPTHHDYELVGPVILTKPFDQRLASADAVPSPEVTVAPPEVEARGHTPR